MFFFYLDSFTSIKKNINTATDGVNSVSNRVEVLEGKLDRLVEIVLKMDQKMDTILQRVNRSSEDITPYFPVQNQQQLINFMSNADMKFSQRKMAFEEMLTDALKMEPDPNAFTDTLFSILFTKEYSKNHRWPNAKYVN